MMSIVVLISGCYPNDDTIFEELKTNLEEQKYPDKRTPVVSINSVSFSYSTKTQQWKANIDGSYIAYDYSIVEYGLIYTYSTSDSDMELSLDSYREKGSKSTSENKSEVKFTVADCNPNEYYFYFKIYVKTADGQVFYSDLKKTNIFS